jgi:hypothetical protein
VAGKLTRLHQRAPLLPFEPSDRGFCSVEREHHWDSQEKNVKLLSMKKQHREGAD